MHMQAGHALPPDCAIDVDGNPTADPATALAGAQLPFGKHKGARRRVRRAQISRVYTEQ